MRMLTRLHIETDNWSCPWGDYPKFAMAQNIYFDLGSLDAGDR